MAFHSEEYALFRKHLADARREAGLTQMEVARRMGKPPSFINKCELGERRMDIVEIRAFCKVAGLSFGEFLDRFEALALALDARQSPVD